MTWNGVMCLGLNEKLPQNSVTKTFVAFLTIEESSLRIICWRVGVGFETIGFQLIIGVLYVVRSKDRKSVV